MTKTRSNFDAWPIVVFDLAAEDTSAEQSSVVLQGLKQALARQQPFATVTDLSRTVQDAKGSTDAYKEFVNEHRDALRRFCKGGALVVESSSVRLVVNTFVLVARMPFTTRAFPSRQEALQWCSAQLKASNT